MKMRRLSLLAASALVGATAAAQAETTSGLFIEPGITYEMGKSSVDYPSPLDNSSGTVNGLGLVGRVGVHLNESFFLAIDGRYAQPQFKDSTNDFDSKATSYHFAPVVGVQMPNVGARVWAGYVMASELDPEESKGVDLRFKDGQGYQVGAGVRLSAVSLNLEYRSVRYKSTELQKLGPFSPNTSFDSVKFTDNAFIGSVTFPLEL